MHKVQIKMKEVENAKDDRLVEEVLSAWQFVCTENEAHKGLVTPDQFKQWESFKESTTTRLRDAVKGYDGKLTDAGRSTFREVASSIRSATHKSDIELAGDELGKTVEVKVDKKRRKWLGMLG